jgi:hypothetical protein
MDSLGECKESEASEPFKPEIETLELRLTETTKKINLIKKVESSFNILSEVSASYSLDLQLGKFTHKVRNAVKDIRKVTIGNNINVN